MARPGISYDIVAHAADTLVGRGEKPTIQAVREEIGTGSPNTIHRHLQDWRATQAPAARKTATLSDELANALADDIERQASSARADAEADALEARQTADHLAEIGETLESEAEDLRHQVEQLTTERGEAVRDCSEARQVIAEFREHVKTLEKQRDDARQELAEARNRIKTLEEHRDADRAALAEAVSDAKAADASRVDAERTQAVAMAKLEAAQAQATERLDALKSEQQARKADTEAHQKALAEQRDEWKERLKASETQRENAEKRASEAESARTHANLQVEVLKARVEALEAEKGGQQRKQSKEEQPTLPFDDYNPA